MAITNNVVGGTNELTGSDFNRQFIGAEVLLNRRDIYKAIHNRYREGEGLADLLIGLGKKKKTVQTTYNWFEHDYLINTISGSVSAKAADQLTVEVTPDDGAGGAGSFSPGLVGDIVMVNTPGNNERVRCRIQAIVKGVTHDYTLERVNDAIDLTSVFTAPTPFDVDVYWFSNAFGDGTFQPESSMRKPLKFNGQTQIIKTQFEAFGSEAANAVEVEINGKPWYYRQGVEDALNKHMMAVEMALILGTKSDGLVDADGNDVTTTQGLESVVDERGNTLQYTSLTYGDFEDMVKRLDKERAPEVYMGLLGTDLMLDFESLMHSRGVGIKGVGADGVVGANSIAGGTGVDYSTVGGKGRAYDFGLDSYRLGGRTFHIKKWDAINYAPITGYDSSVYPKMGFFMPMVTFKDAKSGEMLDSICLRYKENDLENRFMTEWTRDRKQTNKDAFEWNHQCEVGLQVALANQHIKLQAV
jgi:hypothetical protein